MAITSFYYLYYQDQALAQIIPEQYKPNTFKVFHDESKGIIKIEHSNVEVCLFHWNEAEYEVKVLKRDWEDGVIVLEQQAKTLSLTDKRKQGLSTKKDNYNWKEIN